MRQQLTKIGWQFLVKWKDVIDSWVQSKDLKESNPLEVAKYATARGVKDKTDFSWWVPYTKRKCDFIMTAVSSRV